MTDPLDLDAVGQAKLVRDGQVSAAELVDAALERIDRLDPTLNAVIHRLDDKARQAAADPVAGPLSGVPFLIKDADWRATADIVDAVRIPRIAPSLGGVESLIEQPLVMSYYQCTPEDRRAYGIPDNMIRLSCGIENPDDLIADLAQALDVSA